MSARIVASPVAALDASGAGYVESQQYAAAAHTAISHIFRMNVSKGSDMFSAFSWKDLNTEGTTSGETAITDLSLNQLKFRDALMAVINDASGGKLADASGSSIVTAHGRGELGDKYTLPYAFEGNAASPTIRYVLQSEVRNEVEQMLNANGVLEYLEGDTLGNFVFAVDASGGAANMSTLLSADAALRNLILQFPNRPSEFGAGASEYTKLPVIAGDEITFVFNVSASVMINQTTEAGSNIVTGAGAAVANAPAENLSGSSIFASGGNTTSGLNVSTTTRKVAFIVKVTA